MPDPISDPNHECNGCSISFVIFVSLSSALAVLDNECIEDAPSLAENADLWPAVAEFQTKFATYNLCVTIGLKIKTTFAALATA